MSLETQVERRARDLSDQQLNAIHRRTDRLFAGLMLFQYVAGIVAALVISPRTWTGPMAETHLHVWAAVLLGGLISGLPIVLAIRRPGEVLTRHTIAIGQALTSALLIHLSGGRIETHFHIFGSLAFLAFYRDWRVMITASAIIAVDHLWRGMYFPQSVFGVLVASEWRWLEHAAWVVFEDLFLIGSCLRGVRDIREGADREARLEFHGQVQTGHTELLTAVRGEPEPTTLATIALANLAGFCDASIGALYRADPGSDSLEVLAGYAWSEDSGLPRAVKIGEGLVGEVARSRQVKLLDLEGGATLRVSTGVGTLELRSVILTPLLSGDALKGVLVLGKTEPFNDVQRDLISKSAENIAIQLESALNRLRMLDLLRTTQDQAAALQRQNVAIRRQAELDARNAELEAASRHKTEFLASMSHELRTPLNAMIGYTALTLSQLKGSISAEQLKNLQNAEQSARMLMTLLNDVLDFSKIEAGEMEVFLETIDPREVLEECLLMAQGLALKKPEVEVIEEIPEDLPELETDFTRLKQIVNNLLGNALKATDAGSVTLRAEPMRGVPGIQISVIDTGCGIPADKLDTIFESFKQVEGGTRKKLGGTGLGLAITRRLCDLLGIELGVESELGRGSTFWIKVRPQPASGPTRTEPAEQPQLVARSAMSDEQQIDMDTLLLAHDPTVQADVLFLGSDSTCEALKRRLEQQPLTIRPCDSPEHLLEFARSSSRVWAAVIEPDSNGFELLGQLKADLRTRRIPTLLCHPRGNGNTPIEHISKPIQTSQLTETLTRVAALRQGTLLVVDDDAPTRDLLSSILRQDGFAPEALASAQEALAWLSSNPPPQAILLDLLMPEMDGFQMIRALQENRAWATIPVVVVSGKDLTNAERQILSQGSQLLVQKGRTPLESLPGRLDGLLRSIYLSGGRRVLVIDDNEMNLDLAASVLRDSDYEVITASSGPKGIELARSERPDAILMDLAMPGMDGFEATELLRNDPVTAEMVIVACTAFSVAEFRDRALAAGCDGFVSKPIEPANLVKQLRGIMLACRVRRLKPTVPEGV